MGSNLNSSAKKDNSCEKKDFVSVDLEYVVVALKLLESSLDWFQVVQFKLGQSSFLVFVSGQIKYWTSVPKKGSNE